MAAAVLTGTLEGKKLTLETPTEIIMMGEPTKQRLTFDFADPNNIKYTDQHQRAGGACQDSAGSARCGRAVA